MSLSDPSIPGLGRLGGPAKRVPRLLDPVERRVLGALLEKEQATPEHYPLSINALVNACNQKSNRDPVMELAESDVQDALDRLLADVLVWRSDAARVRKWSHNVDRRWRVDAAGKAILTLLLLRGPQTPGELRSRSPRLHPFASVPEVLGALGALAEGKEPLALELPRQPGQKESRWADLLSGEPDPSAIATMTAATDSPRSSLAERVAILEEKVRALEESLGLSGD